MTRSTLLRFPLAIVLVLGPLYPGEVSALVISEIHYHPRASLDPLETFEFVELFNDTSTVVDISGYSFVEGIAFTFPPGTVLGAYERVVVCVDATAVRAHYGLNSQVAFGDFVGRLDASGERLTLVNHSGAVVQSLRYRDRGKWPVGPDGTGHTLVLRNVHKDSDEPESWTQSP